MGCGASKARKANAETQRAEAPTAADAEAPAPAHEAETHALVPATQALVPATQALVTEEVGAKNAQTDNGETTRTNFSTATEKHLRELFAQLDTKGTGEVSRRVMVLALRRDKAWAELLGVPQRVLQEGPTRKAFEDAFHQIDDDGSGTLSLDEVLDAREHLVRKLAVRADARSAQCPGGAFGDQA